MLAQRSWLRVVCLDLTSDFVLSWSSELDDVFSVSELHVHRLCVYPRDITVYVYIPGTIAAAAAFQDRAEGEMPRIP